MAEVEIGTMTSVTEIRDSAALLHPQIVEQFMQQVLPRLKQLLQHEKEVKDEQKMRPSMTSRETANWE